MTLRGNPEINWGAVRRKHRTRQQQNNGRKMFLVFTYSRTNRKENHMLNMFKLGAVAGALVCFGLDGWGQLTCLQCQGVPNCDCNCKNIRCFYHPANPKSCYYYVTGKRCFPSSSQIFVQNGTNVVCNFIGGGYTLDVAGNCGNYVCGACANQTGSYEAPPNTMQPGQPPNGCTDSGIYVTNNAPNYQCPQS